MQTHNDKCWSWRGHEACARARVAELERQLAEVSKHRQSESERADRVSVELAEAKREIARLEAEVESDSERWSRLTLRYAGEDE